MDRKKSARSKFPPVFWLVILFEFFERGSYYGMMSVLSVYFTDVLLFEKESVGILKSVIQPILYFLPIVAGALADRFGYRKALTVAFALLGTGYFLTAQCTAYTPVFLSLVVMALGAGTFKPIVSGTIARVTDESNSAYGFGVYYWSINLGAFLFPLFLVPFLKSHLGWNWVILAAAIGTGTMLVPTLLFFREPARPESAAPKASRPLLRTIADAFEIIYSPVVLLYQFTCRSMARAALVGGVALLAFLWALGGYLSPHDVEVPVARHAQASFGAHLLVQVDRDQGSEEPFSLKKLPGNALRGEAILFKVARPDAVKSFAAKASAMLAEKGITPRPSPGDVEAMVSRADRKILLQVRRSDWRVRLLPTSRGEYLLEAGSEPSSPDTMASVLGALRTKPELRGADPDKIQSALRDAAGRPFFPLFVLFLFLVSMLWLALEKRVKELGPRGHTMAILGAGAFLLAALWFLPGLTVFARILTSVISLTSLSLLSIDVEEGRRFRDHFRFLLMIFLYSGFWVLYFQMFDSVLWYVKAYVDATPLNQAVNGLFAALGVSLKWRFDVEHVTVINGGTIILLQLLVSRIVEKTRALPTMIFGILLATVGMSILALSTHIAVFVLGTVIFSIGEMTAHPKFISYVGQTAPKDRMALYMGYIFLYGVIGSSIGGILGARLYVQFVDNLNQPRTLWLIFAGIGVATMAGLLLYNRFAGSRKEIQETE